MSRPLYKGKAPYKPLSNKAIHRILHDNNPQYSFSDDLPSVEPKKQASDVQDAVFIFKNPDEPDKLYRHYEYDSLLPSEAIKSFLGFLRTVKPRYDENFRLVGEADLKSQDLLHKIEMSDDMDGPHGYDMYKRVREIRRERRVCKNENELLRPVINFLEQNPSIISDLERLQGACQRLKETINDRHYTMRTDVFSDLLEDEDVI